jgi:flagellar hook-associated protein 2
LGIKNGDTLSIQVKGKTATVTVADITVETVDEDGNPVTTSRAMTIEDLQKQMKIEMAADEIFESINFNFDTNVGAFIINSKKTGVDESISLIATNVDPSDPDNENPWEILGIQSVDGIMEYSGQNAIYTYNGGVALESTTNTVNINGLKATIIGESKGVPVTIAAVKDTEATLEVARNFVDEYNKLIEEINTLVDAPSARNYRPLTDEQKESMSESDIKLWNERVQSGILRKDSVLSSIVNDMREIVGKSDLFKLGIGTGKDWTEKGKLYIDEAKLSKIIEEDPEMFDSILKDVGTKLYDNISTKLRGTKDKSSNFLFADKVLTKQITDSTDKISTLEDRLVKQEDLYYAKFTAMEKMLSQLNSQSSWLSSQF